MAPRAKATANPPERGGIAALQILDPYLNRTCHDGPGRAHAGCARAAPAAPGAPPAHEETSSGEGAYAAGIPGTPRRHGPARRASARAGTARGRARRARPLS